MKDRKEYMRVWRKKNRDKINQKYKEWRESKGDELRPYKREQRKRNKDRLVAHLGGKCVGCGVTENLQFDHIDRTQKEFSISTNRDKPYDILLKEAEKCQLLCEECHRIKTRVCYDNAALLKGHSLSSIEQTDGRITIIYEQT